MAMLAEPRRKQRIGPNPRGKFFQEDDDNRGRQMLMKMGWKNGDGLGAERQGMSEPIKPKVNTDSRGLGFDKTTDPWVAHNEEFEQLLKYLNSDGDGTISKQKALDEDASNSSNEGLYKKSKGSRSRIHYHKFVRNKDLSRASTKDIGCIFGKVVDETGDIYAVLNSGTTNQEEPRVQNGTENIEVDLNDNLSPDEKSKKKKKKRNKDLTEEPTEESNLNGLIVPEPEETPAESEIKIKKKKKRDKYGVTEELNEETSLNDSEAPKAEETTVEGEIKKKKKKRDKRGVTEEPIEETSIDDAEVQKPEERTVEVEIKKKKKNRDKVCVEELPEDSSLDNLTIMKSEETSVEGEIKIKKKKKRDKYLSDEASEEIKSDDSNLNVELTNSVEESAPLNSEVNKKKKKKCCKANDIEEIHEEEESEVNTVKQLESDEESTQNDNGGKKKKGKKNKSKENDGEKCVESENLVMSESNVDLHEVVDNAEQQNELDNEKKLVKKEKKKSKKRKHDDSYEEETTIEIHDAGQQSDLIGSEECVTSNPERKKKKKRKHELDENEAAQEQVNEPLKTPEDVSSTNTTTAASKDGGKVESFGSLTFINRGSLHDYFRNKMMSRGLKCSI